MTHESSYLQPFGLPIWEENSFLKSISREVKSSESKEKEGWRSIWPSTVFKTKKMENYVQCW